MNYTNVLNCIEVGISTVYIDIVTNFVLFICISKGLCETWAKIVVLEPKPPCDEQFVTLSCDLFSSSVADPMNSTCRKNDDKEQ